MPFLSLPLKFYFDFVGSLCFVEDTFLDLWNWCASYAEEVVSSEEENYYKNHDDNECNEYNGNDENIVHDENDEFSNDDHFDVYVCVCLVMSNSL